jgi:glucosamine--fructose-6-phosphate aminotransferase (isomerizing)
LYTKEEILSQPGEFKKVLSYLNQLPTSSFPYFLTDSDVVYFVGCGSSYYLGISACKYFSRVTGIETKAIPSGELLLSDIRVMTSTKLKYSAVMISRSGNTTETVLAAEKLNKIGIKTFGITLDGKSDLQKVCSLCLTLPLEEKSVVMTKSFSCMLLSLFFISDKISGKEPKYNQLVNNSNEFVKESCQLEENQTLLEANHYVFLGSGIYEGIARESALKLQEMSLSMAEAFSSLEYRHGPKALVTNDTVIVLYSSGQSEKEEMNLLDEMRELGASIICRSPIAEDGRDAFIQIIFAQLLGLFIAKRKGLNPDQPRNLSKTVILNHSFKKNT